MSIALEAWDKGMMGITLRYPHEVRNQSDYFDDIKDEKVPKDMLDLALHIVGTKRGDFDPEKFEDQYEDALKELLRKKQKGEKIERPREPARSNVVNLMDALRESIKAESGNERRKLRRTRTEHRPAATRRQSARIYVQGLGTFTGQHSASRQRPSLGRSTGRQPAGWRRAAHAFRAGAGRRPLRKPGQRPPEAAEGRGLT
jgi:hypothetical protein